MSTRQRVCIGCHGNRATENPNETHRLNCSVFKLNTQYFPLVFLQRYTETKNSCYIYLFTSEKKRKEKVPSAVQRRSSCFGRASLTSSEGASRLTAAAAAGAVKANWPSPRPRRSSWSQTGHLECFQWEYFHTLRSFRRTQTQPCPRRWSYPPCRSWAWMRWAAVVDKKAETKASMSASPLVSFAAQNALLQVSLTLLTSVTFSSQGGESKPPSAAREHATFRCLLRVTTFLKWRSPSPLYAKFSIVVWCRTFTLTVVAF